MFQENFYIINSNFSQSSGFAEKRNYGNHEGVDYTSKEFKKQNIYNLFTGQVSNFGQAQMPGNYVILRHNFKFIRGEDDYFYTAYKHLSKIDILVNFRHEANLKNNIINPGEIIGKMGNTGYSLTRDKNKWRELTDIEKSDPLETRGVHLHLETFQFTSNNRMTPLLQKFINSGWVKENDRNCYFYDFGKLFINPDLLMSYARLLLVGE